MSEVKVPVEVTLKLPDNREFVVHTNCLAEYADTQEFWYTDGNGACDCNRAIMLNREYNLGLTEECAEVIDLVKLVVNGNEVKI